MKFQVSADPYCDSCGREAAECICHEAAEFPDELPKELDADYLCWGIFVEAEMAAAQTPEEAVDSIEWPEEIVE